MAAKIEALYRIGDAVRRRRIVRHMLGAAPGERILDVGCGPGFYCAVLAEEVGPSGSVVGVDSRPAMLELAARRCAGHDNVELRPGEAVSLPVDNTSLDAALWSAFVVGRNGITDELAQAWFTEPQQLGQRAEFYFSSTQLCFTATKPP